MPRHNGTRPVFSMVTGFPSRDCAPPVDLADPCCNQYNPTTGVTRYSSWSVQIFGVSGSCCYGLPFFRTFQVDQGQLVAAANISASVQWAGSGSTGGGVTCNWRGDILTAPVTMTSYVRGNEFDAPPASCGNPIQVQSTVQYRRELTVQSFRTGGGGAWKIFVELWAYRVGWDPSQYTVISDLIPLFRGELSINATNPVGAYCSQVLFVPAVATASPCPPLDGSLGPTRWGGSGGTAVISRFFA